MADYDQAVSWSPAQQAAASANNAALNTKLTELFGFNEGGANRVAMESTANSISKNIASSGLVQNLQTQAAKIKGQYGAYGEEFSVKKSADAEAGSKDVGALNYPYDETNITPPKKITGKDIKAGIQLAMDLLPVAAGLLPVAASLAPQLLSVGKNMAPPGGGAPDGQDAVAARIKSVVNNLPGNLKGTVSADSITKDVDEQIKRSKIALARAANIDASNFDPDKIQEGLKKINVSDIQSQIKAKLPKLEAGASRALTKFSSETSKAVDIAEIPGFENPLKSIANASLPNVAKLGASPDLSSIVNTATGAAPGLLNLAGSFASTALPLAGAAAKTLSIPGIDPSKAAQPGTPASVGNFVKSLSLKQTATPSADNLGDTLPKAVQGADNRAQFFPADKLEAQNKDLRAGLEKQFEALGIPKIQERKVTQADIDQARKLSAADIAAGKPESEWRVTPQQAANNSAINDKLTSLFKPKIEAIANSGPANDFRAQAEAYRARLEARFGPAAANATPAPLPQY